MASVSLLFRFAIIADTHVNPTDGESNSPWAVNALANARTEQVISQVAAERPDFTVHLGDMVHPVPGNPGYRTAAERFFTLAAGLGTPLHLVPGNHDAGDKPVRWAPASPIGADSLAAYRETFGASHYSFDHQGIHFIVLTTMLINSGSQAEDEQRQWLLSDLQAHADARIMVFSHYPLFLTEPDEPECYDNTAEPGRSWLIELLHQYEVEAYFCGHVHNFFYNRSGNCDLYVLPSTSFVRHDYSELDRVGPGAQYGRDDTARLGHVIVEVHQDGHRVHLVRSHDETADRARVSMRDDSPVPVGMDMREPWAERVGLPYNGMLDEFTRRRVRNDYPLLALWELGIRTLRVPLTDLLDPELQGRMLDLTAAGHRFHAFSYDLPQGRAAEVLHRMSGRLAGFELVLPPEELDRSAVLHGQLACPLTVSALHTSAHNGTTGTVFAHRVAHGFDPDHDLPTITADGVSFVVAADRVPWQEIHRAADRARRADRSALVHVTLAGPDPATDPADPVATAHRVAESVLAAWDCGPGVEVFLDTLAAVDRGYFPRPGLTDRRHAPALPGRVFRHLHAALLRYGPSHGTVAEDGTGVSGGCLRIADRGRVALLLPSERIDGAEVSSTTDLRTADVVDLVTGDLRSQAELRGTVWGRPALLLANTLE